MGTKAFVPNYGDFIRHDARHRRERELLPWRDLLVGISKDRASCGQVRQPRRGRVYFGQAIRLNREGALLH